MTLQTGGDTSRFGEVAYLLSTEDLEAPIYGVIFVPIYGKSAFSYTTDGCIWNERRTDRHTHVVNTCTLMEQN